MVQKLSQFDARQDWYLGKPSLPEPLEILDRDRNNHQVIFALPKAITSVAWKHVIHSFEPLVKIQVAKGISLYVCMYYSWFLLFLLKALCIIICIVNSNST